MPKWALLALTAAAHAAVIRGVVVEHQTGHALSQALVVCTPVAGTAGTVQSARTNNSGAFEFSTLPGGAYLLSASRRGFAPVQYGQKQYHGAGLPIILEEASATFINLRLPRLGSITGIVADENDVGVSAGNSPVAGAPVFLESYDPASRRRLTDLRTARTDMRGQYHFYGVAPGNYRLLSSFEFQNPDAPALDAANARIVKAEEARDLSQDLDLYVIR